MDKLIEALSIFLKYENSQWPTHCEHDVMWIADIEPDEVSEEDKRKLLNLGFFVDEEDNCFKSYTFGSA